jgi:hypothetical protein
MLTNTVQNRAPVDYRFTFNPFAPTNGKVIAGDWNGNGQDSVGLYHNGFFSLTMEPRIWSTITTFVFGPTQSGWMPLAGDWNENHTDTIGVYKDGNWRLRNVNAIGNPDIGFTFRGAGVPVANYRGGMVALARFAAASENIVLPTATMLPPMDVTATPIPTAIAPDEVTEEVSVSVETPTPTPLPTATATLLPTLTASPEPTLHEPEPTLTLTQAERTEDSTEPSVQL